MLAVLLALFTGFTGRAHAAQAPSTKCQPIAHQIQGNHYQISAGSGNCISVIVTLQDWLAPSADGRPLAEQELWTTGFDGPLPTYPTVVDVYLQGVDTNHDSCFHQVDFAYGHARENLQTPYGSDLIRAWHTGTDNCFWTPPTETPPASTPPVTTPPVETTPPTTAPPVETTTPPAPTTTPPAVTTTPAPTTPVTTPPVKPTHKPKPKPTKTHVKPTPKPTSTNPAGGSGCVGSGCDTPKPTPSVTTPPKPELPYTGFNWVPVTLAALGLIILGGAFLVGSRLSRRPE